MPMGISSVQEGSKQQTKMHILLILFQRLKIFQEREISIYNQKIRELHDLLKLKDAEINVSSAETYHTVKSENMHPHHMHYNKELSKNMDLNWNELRIPPKILNHQYHSMSLCSVHSPICPTRSYSMIVSICRVSIQHF